jgi:diguanylate cyclase (GGDEF)-like protein
MTVPNEMPIVLIVDDVPMNVKILAEALRSDYRIKVAKNGADALIRANLPPHPDLILLDVMMPEMDGHEVLRRLKQDTETRKIPVIFVTAKTQENDEQFGLDLGAVDYISKPFSIPIMKARVRNHIAMKQQADLLEVLSLIDPLTHIPNRRGLDENFDIEWRRAQRDGLPLSVLMIDIDHFKSYNDHYGHGAGDECLRRVAGALTTGISRPGDMIARYGGEEFFALLPATHAAAAHRIGERLRERVWELNLPHAYSGVADRVSISVGCATAEPCSDISSPEQLLQQADIQLYRAKDLGRNRVSSPLALSPSPIAEYS